MRSGKDITAMHDEPQLNVAADWLRALERTAHAVRRPERTFGLIIDELAATYYDRLAIISDTQNITYSRLAALTNQYARWCLINGVNKGECVALLMPNNPEYIPIWSGISRVGGIAALINPNLRGQALAHCLDIVSPIHVIVAAEVVEEYRSILPLARKPAKLWIHAQSANGKSALCDAVDSLPTDPLTPAEAPAVNLSDSALYIFTSGTTGLPKAANVSHRRIIEWSYWFAGLMNTQMEDRMYNCLPMYHSVGGIVAPGCVLVSGGSVVIRTKFSAGQFWDDVANTGCTLFQYIGELCRYLINAPSHPRENSHQLRICCGNGLGGDIWNKFKSRFKIPRIIEFYAATEGSFSLFNVEGKPGVIGRLPAFMRHRSPIAIVKFDYDSGCPVRDHYGFCIRCEANEPGEAIGRLSFGKADVQNRFEGYAGVTDNEEKIIRNVFSHDDAWFRTGDLMKMDKTGYFEFIDRIGDTFRWKGENVSTLEVESVIASYPGIEDVTAYGVRIPSFDGRAGMAAIVTNDTFDPASFYAFVSERLPSYARPLFTRIVDNLSMTETFKRNKRKLVEEGFDRSIVRDVVLVCDEKARAYVPMTAERLVQIGISVPK